MNGGGPADARGRGRVPLRSSPAATAAGERNGLPARAATGSRQESCATARLPCCMASGAASPCAMRWSLAATSAVPVWKRTASPSSSGSSRPPRDVRSTVTSVAGSRVPGATRHIPRARSAVSTPATFRLVRSPASATGRSSPWTSTRRTRSSRPSGRRKSRSSGSDAPRVQRPGDDRPEALHRKGTVDPEAGRSCGRIAENRPSRRGRERGLQVVEALAGDGRDGDELGVLEERLADQLSHLGLDDGSRLLVHEVRLRPHEDAAPHVEKREDGEVLARLRHDRVVGGDDEERDVDARRAGDHRPHELLVTRDVHEGEDRSAPSRVGEAEVDRDPARLLLGEAVRVGPGQRPHERALAVVDVPCGADENARHTRSIRDRGPGGIIRRS